MMFRLLALLICGSLAPRVLLAQATPSAPLQVRVDAELKDPEGEVRETLQLAAELVGTWSGAKDFVGGPTLVYATFSYSTMMSNVPADHPASVKSTFNFRWKGTNETALALVWDRVAGYPVPLTEVVHQLVVELSRHGKGSPSFIGNRQAENAVLEGRYIDFIRDLPNHRSFNKLSRAARQQFAEDLDRTLTLYLYDRIALVEAGWACAVHLRRDRFN